MLEDMRFLEWDYPNDTVIEYERDGECNGCGACCTTVIAWRAAMVKGGSEYRPNWNPRNGELTSEHKGVITEVQINGKSRYFSNIVVTEEKFRCGMLTDDNRCRVHAGKMLISRAWPMSPKQAAAFSECSYTFREVGRWKISELEAERA